MAEERGQALLAALGRPNPSDRLVSPATSHS